MNPFPAPETVVQRQLDAYNARDLDAILATYAANAQQFEHPGKLIASGQSAIRERMAIRFQEKNLHAKLIQRVVMGHIVIDYEEVTRSFPEGTGTCKLVAIYEVREGLIQSASVAISDKILDAQ